ncbi:MAG: hypothetical protein K0R59_1027 [Sphingobacterium sp.]|jgi:hypothetical protein|nr:hypothetical protein [Sphingobacterium sp.]
MMRLPDAKLYDDGSPAISKALSKKPVDMKDLPR